MSRIVFFPDMVRMHNSKEGKLEERLSSRRFKRFRSFQGSNDKMRVDISRNRTSAREESSYSHDTTHDAPCLTHGRPPINWTNESKGN